MVIDSWRHFSDLPSFGPNIKVVKEASSPNQT